MISVACQSTSVSAASFLINQINLKIEKMIFFFFFWLPHKWVDQMACQVVTDFKKNIYDLHLLTRTEKVIRAAAGNGETLFLLVRCILFPCCGVNLKTADIRPFRRRH